MIYALFLSIAVRQIPCSEQVIIYPTVTPYAFSASLIDQKRRVLVTRKLGRGEAYDDIQIFTSSAYQQGFHRICRALPLYLRIPLRSNRIPRKDVTMTGRGGALFLFE